MSGQHPLLFPHAPDSGRIHSPPISIETKTGEAELDLAHSITVLLFSPLSPALHPVPLSPNLNLHCKRNKKRTPITDLGGS